jgi:penicillin-binding protein 1C
LALSLNIPAVELANNVGVGQMNEKLGKGGLSWIASHQKSLGLSVILGGCGVTLTELTRLYSCLANKGINYPLYVAKSENTKKADTLFSPEACWMTTEILTSLRRPDLPNNFDNSVNLPHIAWKTGTSYGRRDAWSIGYNPDYTVGVWVGNFNGNGVPELSGSDFATPILFNIFNYITYNKQPVWFSRPTGLDFRLVCNESGLPPGEDCSNLITEDYIPAVSPNRKCDHMVRVFTNSDSSISYCRSCLPPTGYRTVLYPNLSPGLMAFYEEERIPWKKIPPHNPLCTRILSDDQPIITSLSDGREYILYTSAQQQLQLSCNTSPDVNKVYWYINDRFLREAGTGDKIFFSPAAGMLKISCCDDKGRNTDIRIKVSYL